MPTDTWVRRTSSKAGFRITFGEVIFRGQRESARRAKGNAVIGRPPYPRPSEGQRTAAPKAVKFANKSAAALIPMIGRTRLCNMRRQSDMGRSEGRGCSNLDRQRQPCFARKSDRRCQRSAGRDGYPQRRWTPLPGIVGGRAVNQGRRHHGQYSHHRGLTRGP